MKTALKKLCVLLIVTTLLTTFSAVSLFLPNTTCAAAGLSLTAASNASSYYIREPVTLAGLLTESGSPATNFLVGVEVDNQVGTPLLFRTVSIGNPAYLSGWPLTIVSVNVTDSSGNPTNSIALPANGGYSQMGLMVTLHNNLATSYNVVATGTVFDGNLIPISAQFVSIGMTPNNNVEFSWTVNVPGWAYSGEALATVNVYSNFTRDGGVPYVPESQCDFYLTRNSEIATPYSILPTANSSSTGQYSVAFTMPPDIYTLPGTYTDFVAAVSPATQIRTEASTSFTLLDPPSPPQAAFTYTPLQPYDNMSVLFDASSSSAEGYNTTITSYQWTINDPNNEVVSAPQATPTISHTFAVGGTYVVTLNVTNSQNLWSTTSKPVVVLPDFGPTANFTWSPPQGSVNATVIFDASSSQTGWSGRIGGYASITSYTWNFGDGTIITTSNSTIQHVFSQVNNYTVSLTVTDSVSRTGNLSQLVQVLNFQVWDVLHLGKDDIRDVHEVALAYGSFGPNYFYPGSPASSNWNPICDITGPNGVPDNKVDILDVHLVALHYGQTD